MQNRGNTSVEQPRFGLRPEDVVSFIYQIAKLPALSICGLMIIGAFLPDTEDVRPCFRLRRQLQQELISQQIEGLTLKYLSNGDKQRFRSCY